MKQKLTECPKHFKASLGLYYTVAEIDMYGDTTGFQLETSSPLGYVIVREKNKQMGIFFAMFRNNHFLLFASPFKHEE